MAIIKQGILGGFKGKVGNVTGTSWKGRAVMKSRPLSVANPRTVAQIEQRTKLKDCTLFASNYLNTVIKPIWDKVSGNVSGFNAFCSTNIPKTNTTQNVFFATYELSRGRLNAITNATYDVSATEFKLKGNYEFGRYGKETDAISVVAIAYDPAGKVFNEVSDTYTQSELNSEIILDVSSLNAASYGGYAAFAFAVSSDAMEFGASSAFAIII